jgi:hypothetical protein
VPARVQVLAALERIQYKVIKPVVTARENLKTNNIRPSKRPDGQLKTLQAEPENFQCSSFWRIFASQQPAIYREALTTRRFVGGFGFEATLEAYSNAPASGAVP